MMASYSPKHVAGTHLLTYSLTHSLTPWSRVLVKLTSSQLVKKFPAFLWNPNVHYRIHKCPPTVPILSHTDPIHASTSHFLKIHLNIILASTPGYSKWSLTLRFPHQYSVYTSYPYALHAQPISLFSIWSPEQYRVKIKDLDLLCNSLDFIMREQYRHCVKQPKSQKP
jgi:hypothetical protein